MQTAIVRAINGVDIEKLHATVKAIQETPELAAFCFRARNKWIAGGHNRSTVSGFYGAGSEDASRKQSFVMDADEPEVLLGKDNAANPAEFLLHALAACMTTSMAYHAAANGIVLDTVESELEGDLDLRGFLGLSSEVPKGYQALRVTFRVKTEEEAAKLQELTRFSPILDTITRPVPVTVRVVTSKDDN